MAVGPIPDHAIVEEARLRALEAGRAWIDANPFPHVRRALWTLYGADVGDAVLREVVNSYPEGFCPGGVVLTKMAEKIVGGGASRQ